MASHHLFDLDFPCEDSRIPVRKLVRALSNQEINRPKYRKLQFPAEEEQDAWFNTVMYIDHICEWLRVPCVTMMNAIAMMTFLSKQQSEKPSLAQVLCCIVLSSKFHDRKVLPYKTVYLQTKACPVRDMLREELRILKLCEHQIDFSCQLPVTYANVLSLTIAYDLNKIERVASDFYPATCIYILTSPELRSLPPLYLGLAILLAALSIDSKDATERDDINFDSEALAAEVLNEYLHEKPPLPDLQKVVQWVLESAACLDMESL